jgi:hypothetical protein
MTMNTNTYNTSDLPLAAYLAYRGFIIDCIGDSPTKHNAKEFCFSRKQGLKIEDEILKFQNREALVDPLRYFDEIRNLKNRMYHTA